MTMQPIVALYIGIYVGIQIPWYLRILCILVMALSNSRLANPIVKIGFDSLQQIPNPLSLLRVLTLYLNVRGK